MTILYLFLGLVLTAVAIDTTVRARSPVNFIVAGVSPPIIYGILSAVAWGMGVPL